MGLLLCFIQIIAEVLGLGYAYVFGASILGALFKLLYHTTPAQMIHSIPTLFPHFPHTWSTALLSITAMHIGLLWITLYLSLRLLFLARALPAYIKTRGNLAKPAPGGEMETPVNRCYGRFEAYATKATYPPLDFRVPRSFRYRPGAPEHEIGWIGLTLVLNSHLCKSPSQLAPRLAREIGTYNSLDRYYKILLSGLPPVNRILGIFIGLGISLPSLLKKYVWCFYWRKRVFELDQFAVLLGCGSELLRALESERYHQSERGIFRNTPYIEERIDALKAHLQQQQVQPKP